MDSDAKMQFIAGQHAATVAMLRAIIKTHTDQDALKTAFDMSCHDANTSLEPKPLTEDYFAGMRAQSRAIWSGLHT
jgi:hypothetical protein